MSWKFLHIGPEGDSVFVGSVSVWACPWKTQGEEGITVRHPAYPDQEHRLDRYFVEAGGETQEFAAGEVSPGVWLFFTPVKGSENSLLLHVATYFVGAAGCFILIHGFQRSPKYIALGSVLVVIALGAEWYAKSKRRASEA